jgi:hypothetical protein
VTRPVGRGLVIGADTCRSQSMDLLHRLGFTCAESDNPYSAMAELSARPLAYNAIIISLNCLYKEELQIIRAVKSRWGHVEIWLAHTDGRQAAMVEAMRLGADGILADDGLHRLATTNGTPGAASTAQAVGQAIGPSAMPLATTPTAAQTPKPAPMRAAGDRSGNDRMGNDRSGNDRAGNNLQPFDRSAADQTSVDRLSSPDAHTRDSRETAPTQFSDINGFGANEPILSADELRALLQEQPAPQGES